MSNFMQRPGTSGSGFVVAVVGASGAVGVELVRCLEERGFPVAELKLFASARSAGKHLNFRGQRGAD
jgi:aspartate-semialdehyde dehydrogenase